MKLYKWNAIASHAVNIKTRKTLFHADKIFPVKPLVPLRDQDPIFSHNINITGSSQVMRIKKNINWGIISWSIQNSPNWHRENLMTESEENYEQDLGSERVNLTSKFHRNILHKEVCHYTFRVSKSLPCAKKLFFFFLNTTLTGLPLHSWWSLFQMHHELWLYAECLHYSGTQQKIIVVENN